MSNEAPVLTGIDSDQVFGENTINEAPVLLAPTAVYSDDAVDQAWTTIRVLGVQPDDRLTFINDEHVTWDEAGNIVYVDGAPVGSVIGGVGTNLTVNILPGSTPAQVQAVIRAIAYQSVSDTPSASHDLNITITDSGFASNITVEWTQLTGPANPLNGVDLATSGGQATAGFYDADGDGDLDLVAGNAFGTLETFLNNGDGSFATTPWASNPFSGIISGFGNSRPFFGDYDGDGDLDLAFAVSTQGMRYYRNDGGTFVQQSGGDNPLAATYLGASHEYVISQIDADGDGDLDIVSSYASFPNGRLAYFENTGSGYVQQTGGANPFEGITATFVAYTAAGDLDGDGDDDLIVGNYYGELQTYLNTGSGFAAAGNPFGYVDMVDYAKATLTDIDGDGGLELVIGGGSTFVVYRQTVAAGAPITVTINAQAEEGDARDDAFSVNESQTVSGDLLADNGNGVDTRGAPPLAITEINGVAAWVGEWIDLPQGGRLLLNADGTFQFDTDGDFKTLSPDGVEQSRQVTFTYTIAGGDTATVTITVNGETSEGDKYFGTSGDETMDYILREGVIANGGDGADIIVGGYSTDSLRGDAGDDFLRGNGGNDTLVGGDGVDNLLGGEGDDVLKTGAGVGAGLEYMDGGNGNDTYYVGKAEDVVLNENVFDGDDLVISSISYALTAGVERLTLAGTAAAGTGNALNNTITGNGVANTLNGEAGNDTLLGMGGNDILNGGGDHDTLDGGAGDDELNGGAGNDSLNGGAGNDSLNGGAGYDVLYGGLGNDSLNGGADELQDSLLGGKGNDTYYVEEGDDVTELAGEGTDKVITSYSGYQLAANVENLQLLTGLSAHGNALNNIIEGNDGGTNALRGYEGADVIYGYGGIDYLYGGLGADTLYGGNDSDALYGDEDNDILYGGAASDNLYGVTGADKLYGEDGNDRLEGGDGNDIIEGGLGVDDVYGGEGADKLYGGDDGDTLRGEAGADQLFGDNGVDQLWGGDGNDQLTGGAGDDELHGGEGVDRLTGGSGADLFRFDADAVRLSGGGLAAQRDTITDFNWADGDRIDLSGIDAIAGGADDAFTFVTRFTKQAGQALLVQSGANTILRLDVDGDGKADHEVLILNQHLTAGDNAWLL